MSEKKFDEWGVVELFGHQKIAGLVTEQSIGGCAFVRVDVPKVSQSTVKYTKLFGNGAIYAITPCSKEIALAVVEQLEARPISPYDIADIDTQSHMRRLEWCEPEPDLEIDEEHLT